jgi:hypothetical protein
MKRTYITVKTTGHEGLRDWLYVVDNAAEALPTTVGSILCCQVMMATGQ